MMGKGREELLAMAKEHGETKKGTCSDIWLPLHFFLLFLFFANWDRELAKVDSCI